MPSDEVLTPPILTVLLPVYNAEKYLKEAIGSILAQTFTDFLLFNIDDSSSDDSLEIAKHYEGDSRVRIYSHSCNRGKVAVVNEAIADVTSEFITIHDADDISLPTRFEKQINLLENNPALGMCGTGFRSFSESGKTHFEASIMKSDFKEIMSDINMSSQFHGPTMMIKKSVIDDLGQLYRPYFSKTNEDTDLAYRIVQKYEATNIQEVLYLYRIHDESSCRRFLDAKSRNLYKLVVFLAQERAEKGYDSLDRCDFQAINNFLSGLLAQYASDKSLEHREAASYLMYFKLYKKAINESVKAILASPDSVLNWRNLFYCIRKTILRQ